MLPSMIRRVRAARAKLSYKDKLRQRCAKNTATRSPLARPRRRDAPRRAREPPSVDAAWLPSSPEENHHNPAQRRENRI
eukprot:31460-Pelagococcus_subviridis.AAC.3